MMHDIHDTLLTDSNQEQYYECKTVENSINKAQFAGFLFTLLASMLVGTLFVFEVHAGENAGDGRLQIHLGEDAAAEDDCFMWDLLDGSTGEVRNGPAANGTEGELIMIESPVRLLGFSDDGVEACVIVTWPEDNGSATLFTISGVPLISVKKRKIYEGGLRELSDDEIEDDYLYKINGDRILDGKDPSVTLATSTASIQHASAWRKLTIGALLEGYCGGNGLPPPPPRE